MRYTLDHWSDRFSHCIDGVSTHGISAIDNQLGDHHLASSCVNDFHLQVLGTATNGDKFGVLLIGLLEKFVLATKNVQPGPMRIQNPDGLDLTDHHWAGVACSKSAVFSGHLCSVARGCNY